MKKLYILRHAKADPDADFNDDHEKPLARKGHDDAALVARIMHDLNLIPDFIISSDSLRTRQTLENMLPILGGDIAVDFTYNLYLATPGEILKQIATVNNDRNALLVVGHNPGVHQLCAFITGGGDPQHIRTLQTKFPTGGLACFDVSCENWQQLNPGCASLENFITPKTLNAL